MLKTIDQRNKNIVGGSVFFVIGAAYTVSIANFEEGTPFLVKLVPLISGLALIIFSLILLIQELAPHRSFANVGRWDCLKSWRRWYAAVPTADRARFVCTAVLLTLYALFYQPIGFVAASMSFLFLQQTVLVSKINRRSVIIAAVVSVGATVCLWLLFTRVFDLFLP